MNSSTILNTSQERTEINQALCACLASCCLKQADLARLIGVNRSYINRIIRGKEKPPNELMIRIAKTLKVDSRVIWP